MKRMWKALVTGVAGVIAVVVVMAASVQAQVPKSGKLAFHNPGHYRAAYLKTGEKASGTAGDWFSVLVPKGDSKFLAFGNNTCLYAQHLLDTENGVIIHKEVCQILDADQDAIFTSAKCRFNSWTDWCNGTIDGGTGKYAGITGTMRWTYSLDAPLFERTQPAGPHTPKALYEAQGEVSLPYELSWKLP